MRDKVKMAFIACVNDDRVASECAWYINRLNVPANMEIDFITIKDAPSMCAGYNAAMKSTDAAYKVYIHQDVFILNRDFPEKLVRAFEENEQYGILGVIGGFLPQNGSGWDHWSVGATYAVNEKKKLDLRSERMTDEAVVETDAVDGMLIATNEDVPWREDVFDGFDFYDLSQCEEFKKRGRKVGVIMQDEPWCIHDCGLSKLTSYDRYREKFCNEYSDKYRFDEYYTVSPEKEEMYKLGLQFLDTIEEAIGMENYEFVYRVLAELKDRRELDNKLNALMDIREICEVNGGVGTFSMFGNSVSEMIERLNEYKFQMRRAALGDESAADFLRSELDAGMLSQQGIDYLKRRFM